MYLRPSSVQKINTQIDTYMSSRTHPAQKQSAINSLVHRASTIFDKEHLETELNHLKLALQKNGYDKKDNQNNQ